MRDGSTRGVTSGMRQAVRVVQVVQVVQVVRVVQVKAPLVAAGALHSSSAWPCDSSPSARDSLDLLAGTSSPFPLFLSPPQPLLLPALPQSPPHSAALHQAARLPGGRG